MYSPLCCLAVGAGSEGCTKILRSTSRKPVHTVLSGNCPFYKAWRIIWGCFHLHHWQLILPHALLAPAGGATTRTCWQKVLPKRWPSKPQLLPSQPQCLRLLQPSWAQGSVVALGCLALWPTWMKNSWAKICESCPMHQKGALCQTWAQWEVLDVDPTRHCSQRYSSLWLWLMLRLVSTYRLFRRFFFMPFSHLFLYTLNHKT